jgi:hypothetical protein
MQTIDKKAEEAKAEKGRYSEGDAHKRGESPSEVKSPDSFKGRSERSATVKSAASAYRKMSESDTNAVGRR